MGYKAMAEKFRQAVGLADPYPAAFALDDGIVGATPTVEDASCQNTVRKADGDHSRGVGDGGDGIRQNTVRKAVRRKAKEMLAEGRRSQRGVWIALARRLSPDQVPPEVEREERRRQGLPARDGLARRFVQMMA